MKGPDQSECESGRLPLVGSCVRVHVQPRASFFKLSRMSSWSVKGPERDC